jgi:hypothetical protein
MFAWVLGVTRTLNAVADVVTAKLQPVKLTVTLAGLETSVHSSALLPSVISTKDMLLNEFATPKVTVSAVTVSEPLSVDKVKASKSVAEAPGASVTLLGSVPSANVVKMGADIVVVPATATVVVPGEPTEVTTSVFGLVISISIVSPLEAPDEMSTTT